MKKDEILERLSTLLDFVSYNDELSEGFRLGYVYSRLREILADCNVKEEEE